VLLQAAAGEASRCRRERDEWQRRCRQRDTRWAALERTAEVAAARLSGERRAQRLAGDALLAMVRERDARLAALQHQLAALAGGAHSTSSGGSGGGGGSSCGGGVDTGAARRLAAEALRDHMVKMQLEDATRAALLVRALATGFAVEDSAPAGALAAWPRGDPLAATSTASRSNNSSSAINGVGNDGAVVEELRARLKAHGANAEAREELGRPKRRCAGQGERLRAA
jgi:hypothetical protein